jgi:periplasmic protein TonB
MRRRMTDGAVTTALTSVRCATHIPAERTGSKNSSKYGSPEATYACGKPWRGPADSHANGSGGVATMTVPAAMRIDPNGLASAPAYRRTDGKLARMPRLRPVGATVPPGAVPDRPAKPRRRYAPAWGVLSLLVHGAAIVGLLTIVQPPKIEAPAPDAGISMVFANVTPTAPIPSEPVQPEPILPEPVPPGTILPEPPPEAVLPEAVLPEAVAPEALTERQPAPVPVPVAPARSTRPARPEAAPRQRTDARNGAPPASVAPAAPSRVAPIIPPRPVAGMADNRPPRYPESARRRQEQGRVMVGVSVATDGTPIDTRIDLSSGHPALDEAAMEAVRRWRFVPASQDDRPVVASAQVPIVFRLQD